MEFCANSKNDNIPGVKGTYSCVGIECEDNPYSKFKYKQCVPPYSNLGILFFFFQCNDKQCVNVSLTALSYEFFYKVRQPK